MLTSLQASAATKTRLCEASYIERIAQCGAVMREALLSGRQILLFGNGGSAADAQHIAAELVGRFQLRGRRGLAAISLATDTSALTAIGNDFSFEDVFARQVEALGRPGDVALGITTSGNSPNVLAALKRAQNLGLRTIALAGRGGGAAASAAELAIIVPSDDTQRIQECHITIGHICCELIERDWPWEPAAATTSAARRKTPG